MTDTQTDTQTDPTFLNYSGNSMWPCFQDGDTLEVQPVSSTKLRIGDCITFRQEDNRIVTHRVFALSGGIQTRADAHPKNDDTIVLPERLLGRVIRCHRLGQTGKVQRGLVGFLFGRIYFYAGRIDPNRNSRGGHLAQKIRVCLQWAAGPLYRKGLIKRCAVAAGNQNCYWMIGKRIMAEQQETGWRVPWPWSLLIDEKRLPRAPE